MPDLFDPALTKTLKQDKKYLENTQVPIITVSATYKEDLKRLHGYLANDTTSDIVFSRAHYSMALGVAVQKWQEANVKQKKQTRPSSFSVEPGTKIAPDTLGGYVAPGAAWIVDPTNYVSRKDWFSIELTNVIGKTLARNEFLKKIKDLIDRFGRKKLPIIDSITEPLLYLTQNIKRPILSFHVAAGNVLAAQGKEVVQMITDPHVRYDYLEHAESPHVHYLVFDPETKLEFVEQAALIDKQADPRRIHVTGPPVDPRVVAMRKDKQPWRSGKLHLCITTGGLDTNKEEIERLLLQLLPELRKDKPRFKLLIYTATHEDIYEMVLDLAKNCRVAVEELDDLRADLRVIYHPQVVDANEQLIRYGFPWADGFITKPSGDMTYDAVAAGCFILTLAEWGEWEHRIREIFEQKGISRAAEVDHILTQLGVLMSSKGKPQSWIESAMLKAHSIDPLFLNGAKEILKAYRKIV